MSHLALTLLHVRSVTFHLRYCSGDILLYSHITYCGADFLLAVNKVESYKLCDFPLCLLRGTCLTSAVHSAPGAVRGVVVCRLSRRTGFTLLRISHHHCNFPMPEIHIYSVTYSTRVFGLGSQRPNFRYDTDTAMPLPRPAVPAPAPAPAPLPV